MTIATTNVLAIALALALASMTLPASAQGFHGDGYPGYSRYRSWDSREVALRQGPSAEEAWFERASRSSGGGS